MISIEVEQYCKNYEQIENYNLAINDDTQVWDCHHRKEISENKSVQQLKEEGCYFNVSPDELVFLTRDDHIKLHKDGIKLSEEHKRKISETQKKNPPFGGKRHSEETRRKMSINHAGGFYGKRHSEETRRKMSINHVGMKGKHFSEESRRKISEALKKSFQNKNKSKGV